MDWLLTDEEIGKAKEDSYEMLPKFCDNWTPGELRQWEDNAIARAAARKALRAVDELILDNTMQSDHGGPFYVRVDIEGLQALRHGVA